MQEEEMQVFSAECHCHHSTCGIMNTCQKIPDCLQRRALAFLESGRIPFSIMSTAALPLSAPLGSVYSTIA